jgi:hypothetical protein
MPANTRAILDQLSLVDAERARRAGNPSLAGAIRRVKAYQQLRFAHTYADLLDSARYAGAARYFLDDLYGPGDFTQRDAQFARVVPAFVRVFPQEIVETVYTLVRLHALSEQLDSAMGAQLADEPIAAMDYIRAWQTASEPAARARQLDFTLSIGNSLDRLTRKPLLRHSLHLMRGPAKAAGLEDLQQFLERGFDTFRAMRGATEFLRIVGERERALSDALFAATVPQDLASGMTPDPALACALGQLP